MEADFGAAAVIDLAEVFQLALGVAAFEAHAMELLAAGDLDLEPGGQRIHHRDAHAVQAARGLIDLGVEFAAGMQRAHDDFECRLFRKFRMRIDRNAAAVVGHGKEASGLEFDLDEARMPGQRLVHRVVDDFGEQMMQRLFVGAADIHAGAAADRLEPLEHLDVSRGVARFRTCRTGRGPGRGFCLRFRSAEEILGSIQFYFWFSIAWAYIFKSCFECRHELGGMTMPWMGSKRGGAALADFKPDHPREEDQPRKKPNLMASVVFSSTCDCAMPGPGEHFNDQVMAGRGRRAWSRRLRAELPKISRLRVRLLARLPTWPGWTFRRNA